MATRLCRCYKCLVELSPLFCPAVVREVMPIGCLNKVPEVPGLCIDIGEYLMASAFGPVAASSNTMGSRAMAAGISPETSMGTPTTQPTMPTMVAPAVHTGTASLGNQGLNVTPSADGQTYTISGADVQAFQKAQVPAANG